MKSLTAAVAAATALFPLPLAAQQPAHSRTHQPSHQPVSGDPATDPACATVRVALPPGLAGWSQRTGRRAGTSAALSPVLLVGRAATVALTQAPVTWATPPEKAPKPATYGGLLQVEVTRAGTYRLALSDAAWADVALRGHRVASSAHKMAPRCSGVRKMVDFPLARGRYVIQLSGAPRPELAAMLVRIK